jgi:hypothetical protein
MVQLQVKAAADDINIIRIIARARMAVCSLWFYIALYMRWSRI